MVVETECDNVVMMVFKYGTVPARIAPVIGAEQAAIQLRLANRLWNLLVAIERARVARYRKVMFDAAQGRIELLKAKLSALRGKIQVRRQAGRRRVDVSDLTAESQEIRAAIKAEIKAHKATSAERHDARRAELDALSETSKSRIKRARQAAASMGLFWGTYNDIVQRADVGRRAGELHFRRDTGDGTLTAQIMGGADPEECMTAHSFFQIASKCPLSGLVAGDVAETDAQPVKWQYARMRIGSTGERQPIWLAIPIVLHRPLPDGARIKSVSMTKRKTTWSLNVTVAEPAPTPKLIGPRVAIDLGWRVVPSGVRVAYWADTLGGEGQVVVSDEDIGQFGRVRSLRSRCDTMRDEYLPVLAAWTSGRELPAEWQAETIALVQWRSPDRLARLIRWWADHRLPGDAEMFSRASAWRKQYLHLANWWRNLEDQMRGRLREQYRIFAAGVAKKYSTVYLEVFHLPDVIETPAAESEEVRTAESRYRQMVSLSVLRAAVRNACTREGCTVVDVAPEYTTLGCHLCGTITEWDTAASLMHQCEGCGAVWDQDQNAAINLLARGASGGAPPTANQPDRPRKWDRVRDRSRKSAQAAESAILAAAAVEMPAQRLSC